MDDYPAVKQIVEWVVTGLLGLISLLALAVSALSKRIWDDHEQRLKANAEAITAHIQADSDAHDKIRDNLATAIENLNSRIDDRTGALGVQITRQHEFLSQQLLNVMNAIKREN